MGRKPKFNGCMCLEEHTCVGTISSHITAEVSGRGFFISLLLLRERTAQERRAFGVEFLFGEGLIPVLFKQNGPCTKQSLRYIP